MSSEKKESTVNQFLSQKFPWKFTRNQNKSEWAVTLRKVLCMSAFLRFVNPFAQMAEFDDFFYSVLMSAFGHNPWILCYVVSTNEYTTVDRPREILRNRSNISHKNP